MDVHRLASAPVVVGVDGSAAADVALDWAAGLAARRRRELHIACGLGLAQMRRGSSRYASWLDSVQEALRAKGAAIVERSQCRVRAAEPGLRVSTEVSATTPVDLLVRHSAAAYLVVLGASGASGFAAHVGSVMLRPPIFLTVKRQPVLVACRRGVRRLWRGRRSGGFAGSGRAGRASC